MVIAATTEWFHGSSENYGDVVEKVLLNLQKGCACRKQLLIAQAMKTMDLFWKKTGTHPKPFGAVLAPPVPKKMLALPSTAPESSAAAPESTTRESSATAAASLVTPAGIQAGLPARKAVEGGLWPS